MACGSMPAAVVLALSLSMAGALAPCRVEAVVSMATAPRALGGKPSRDGQRAADRVIERRVRGAIRADPFLALAAPRVKVTSRRGVVRLVGRVGTPKERSSILFKAGQAGPVDDRVTIGDGVETVAW
jgi:osmotically-inducible protein OsmY